MIVDPAQSSITGDMDVEALRRYGHQIVDWIADYLAHGTKEVSALSQALPGDIRRSLPVGPPLLRESMETILADICRVVMPGITHFMSGRFMVYFSLVISGPSI